MTTNKSKPESQPQLTETDKKILFKCFLDSLGIEEIQHWRLGRCFKLKKRWQTKIIGRIECGLKTLGNDDTYRVFGYPKTNHEICKYLLEHGNKLVIEMVSDEPFVPDTFCPF